MGLLADRAYKRYEEVLADAVIAQTEDKLELALSLTKEAKLYLEKYNRLLAEGS